LDNWFVCLLWAAGATRSASIAVEGKAVPMPHDGGVLEWAEWQQFADRRSAAGIEFIIDPGGRFAGKPGEQATMFLADPSGNALEFKALREPDKLFTKQS